MTYASFLQRMGGAMIDCAIFVLILGFFTKDIQSYPSLVAVYTSIAIAIALILLVVVSVRYSGSPGKLLLNCQIVDAETGNPISVRQGFRRSLGLSLTLLSFGIGFLWILFDKKNQAFHDKFAGTIVVYNGMVDLFDESQKSLRQLLSEVR